MGERDSEDILNYHLYPPFFIIDPHTTFAKAWEDLCRQLLCLEYCTHAIQANLPPDLGEDLYWKSEGILYQCKSVEDGQAGSLGMGEIVNSINKALSLQTELQWRRYMLCTNVILTRKQKGKLMKYLPSIEFMGQGTWVDLCKKFHREVADRFRILVRISEERVLRSLNEAYLHDYERRFEARNERDILPLLIYSDRRKYLFELHFLAECTAEDVLITLRELFELPPPRKLVDTDVSVTLDYSLSIDNQVVPSHKKISELVHERRQLITLWKTIVWYQPPFDLEKKHYMERNALTREWIEAHIQPNDKVVRNAVDEYQQEVETVIADVAQRLLKEHS